MAHDKEKDRIGNITFDNILQLRELLKQAWLLGRVEQAKESLDKERDSYRNLARHLGFKMKEPKEPDLPQTFETWFLDFVKSLDIK